MKWKELVNLAEEAGFEATEISVGTRESRDVVLLPKDAEAADRLDKVVKAEWSTEWNSWVIFLDSVRRLNVKTSSS